MDRIDHLLPDTVVFDGIRHKLRRAEKHLRDVEMLCRAAAKGECSLVVERDEERQWFIQRIRIEPKPDLEIAAAAGDFLNCCRCSLDYFVWQLVLANGNTPGNSNQFPIALDEAAFERALKRGQLKGVSAAAIAAIEALQPYREGNAMMAILNKLNNIDKHHSLNLLAVAADSADLTYKRGGNSVLTLFLEADELRDGAIFGNIALPFSLEDKFPGSLRMLEQTNVKGPAKLFVSLQEILTDAEEEGTPSVMDTLRGIFTFLGLRVIFTLQRFLDQG